MKFKMDRNWLAKESRARGSALHFRGWLDFTYRLDRGSRRCRGLVGLRGQLSLRLSGFFSLQGENASVIRATRRASRC